VFLSLFRFFFFSLSLFFFFFLGGGSFWLYFFLSLKNPAAFLVPINRARALAPSPGAFIYLFLKFALCAGVGVERARGVAGGAAKQLRAHETGGDPGLELREALRGRARCRHALRKGVGHAFATVPLELTE